ncbi:MAG: type II toxin-antitoxin system RelE/ParE family toxin [Candidatus Micrarchaeota archaeon]|nr:type II toxin-antitoxin system RelE/ParE family toxin [Candidatus Micrarchaeota archaeon]
MTYALDISPYVDKIFEKLEKRERGQYEAIMKKIDEIVENPQHYKPLGNVMSGKRRVHFGSFVLVFTIDEARKTVVLEDYDHHDKVYRKP